ncbi:MAG TPA: zinc ribbon domain-containing protein [Planctomycetota bacterium]|nr:zinc ribbon domain-containing protein [Planctomycetota bacterium]
MPIYSYTCEHCGETTELTFGMQFQPQSVPCPKCGVRAPRDIGRDLMSKKQRRCSTWPMESDALGVDPGQIPEFEADARERGVPIEFNRETGAAIFTGPLHRKRYARAYGFHDRNGGYSDP